MSSQAKNRAESKTPQPIQRPTAVALQLLIIAAACSSMTTAIYSPAFFRHLSTGRWIQQHAELPQSNLWTLFAYGKHWIASSWLFDYLLADIELYFAERGLVLLKVALIFAVVFAVAHLYQKLSNSRFIASGLALLVGAGIFTPDAFSAKTVGLLFFVLMLARALRHSRGQNSWSSWLLTFLLAAAAANVHVSFVWGIVFAQLLAIAAPAKEKVAAPIITRFAVVLAAASLLSPYAGQQVIWGLNSAAAELVFNIRHLLSPASLYHYGTAFLIILWTLFAALWRCSRDLIGRTEGLLAFLLSLLALASTTLLPYAAIILGYLIALLWGRAKKESPPESLGEIGKGLQSLERWLSSWPLLGVLWLALCIVIYQTVTLSRTPVLTAALPKQALEFIDREQVQFPLLHSAAIGDYLQSHWQLQGQLQGPLQSDFEIVPKTTVDRRIVVLDPQIAEEELAFTRQSAGAEKFEARVDAKAALCLRPDALCQRLLADENWKLIYDGATPPEGLSPIRARRAEHIYHWLVFQRIESTPAL